MKNVKVKDVEFEVEVEFDDDKRIEQMFVFLPGSEVELSDVLSEKVVGMIEEEVYRQYEGPEMSEDDPREER